MLKLISKKGFTLVEILCSLGVFSIIFVCMMSYEATYLNVKKKTSIINDNIFIMEAIKNNILYTMTFEEVEQLQSENRIFLNKGNMTFNKCNTTLVDAFSEQSDAEKPYMKLSFLKCEFKVYSLSLSLHAGKPNDVLELQCSFYKGCHK